MPSRLVPAAFLALLMTSCQRPLIVDDDNGPEAHWDRVEFTTKAYIQGLLATPYELYVVTENSFSRLNSNLDIIEKRVLPIGNGTPAMGENTFVRLTTNAQNRQLIEFHLARNATEIFRVLVDTLPVPTGNILDIDRFANAIGAFSVDGTRFLMAAKVLPARFYSLYLFDVQLDALHASFVSVTMTKRIDLVDLEANVDGTVRSISFQNGNFYVATQQGAWRITPTGAFVKQFAQWKEACFSWLGSLYMTGTVDYDLDKSTDNGLTWARVNIGSELRHVTVVDTMVFSQVVPGKPYSLISGDFMKALPIVYPKGTVLNSSLFFGLAIYNGRYYFSINNVLYGTDKVITE